MLNMKNIYLIFLILCFYSCKNNVVNDKNQIAAIIGDEVISTTELDSVAEFQLSRIKQNILQSLINVKLIEIYSKERGFSTDSLYRLIFSKTKKTSLSKIDSIQEHKRCYDSLINALKEKYNVGIFISDKESLERLRNLKTYNYGKKDSQTDIIFAFDYECPTCHSVKHKVDSLLKEDKMDISVRYVYFSDYVSPIAIACDAAAKQGKFWPMFNKVFEYDCNDNQNNKLIKIATEIGIDTTKFKQDMKDSDEFIKKHALNRQYLYDIGVYSVPVFIVNGKIIDNYKTLEVYLKKTLK
jgi:hypothetical protein